MRKSCDFQFSFDNPEQIYEAGAPVTGILQLTPTSNIRCNELKLELRWRTHGQGNRAMGRPINLAVDFNEVQLNQGETYEVPFGFDAPSGPLTYHGHYLNIDWYLKAVVDAPLTPGFLDPQGETELLLLPKQGAAIDFGPNYREASDDVKPNSLDWAGLLFGGLFAAGGIIAFIVMFSGNAGSSQIFLLIFAAAFSLVGAWLLFGSVRNALASSKFHHLEATLSTRKLVPGEALNASLSFQAKNPLQLEKLSITLRCIEKVVRGSGSNKKTFTHTVYEETLDVLEAQVLSQSQELSITESVKMPNNAPYSFKASDNELKWEIEYFIDTVGPIDWKQAYQLDVVPWKDDDYIR